MAIVLTWAIEARFVSATITARMRSALYRPGMLPSAGSICMTMRRCRLIVRLRDAAMPSQPLLELAYMLIGSQVRCTLHNPALCQELDKPARRPHILC